MGCEVADNASTGVDGYADLIWQERLAGGIGPLLTLPIEHRETVDDVKGSRACFELMLRNSQRCVPESHDRITDVFVDGSFLTDDCVCERGKQPVYRRCSALRFILVQLGNCGKASYVAEQDGHLPLFSTQHEPLGGLRQLLDERGSKILAEGVADQVPLCLGAVVGREGDDSRQAAQ